MNEPKGKPGPPSPDALLGEIVAGGALDMFSLSFGMALDKAWRKGYTAGLGAAAELRAALFATANRIIHESADPDQWQHGRPCWCVLMPHRDAKHSKVCERAFAALRATAAEEPQP